MASLSVIETDGAARRALRRHARQLRQRPQDVASHQARLSAALALPGVEPVQGVLADLYASLGPEAAALKRDALARAQARLPAHIAQGFAQQIDGPALAQTTPLATRWSLLARPSANMSTRARRCSRDDSRALAEAAVRAVEAGDADAEEVFLQHCRTCRDTLAFMLARRALTRGGAALPPRWLAVSEQLEQIGGAV